MALLGAAWYGRNGKERPGKARRGRARQALCFFDHNNRSLFAFSFYLLKIG